MTRQIRVWSIRSSRHGRNIETADATPQRISLCLCVSLAPWRETIFHAKAPSLRKGAKTNLIADRARRSSCPDDRCASRTRNLPAQKPFLIEDRRVIQQQLCLRNSKCCRFRRQPVVDLLSVEKTPAVAHPPLVQTRAPNDDRSPTPA